MVQVCKILCSQGLKNTAHITWCRCCVPAPTGACWLCSSASKIGCLFQQLSPVFLTLLLGELLAVGTEGFPTPHPAMSHGVACLNWMVWSCSLPSGGDWCGGRRVEADCAAAYTELPHAVFPAIDTWTRSEETNQSRGKKTNRMPCRHLHGSILFSTTYGSERIRWRRRLDEPTSAGDSNGDDIRAKIGSEPRSSPVVPMQKMQRWGCRTSVRPSDLGVPVRCRLDMQIQEADRRWRLTSRRWRRRWPGAAAASIRRRRLLLPLALLRDCHLAAPHGAATSRRSPGRPKDARMGAAAAVACEAGRGRVWEGARVAGAGL